MAVTAWLSPSANSTAAGWTGQANVYVQDGSNATVTIATGETPYFGVYNFVGIAAAVSTATSIDGFEVQFYGRSNIAVGYDYVFVGNAPAGTPQSISSFAIGLPVSGTTSAYGTLIGGPTNTWGGKTGSVPWAVADLDSNFGVSGAWAAGAASTTITWDYVRLKVYYTAPGGTTPKTWWNGWGGT
jgi:hypothetical protein